MDQSGTPNLPEPRGLTNPLIYVVDDEPLISNLVALNLTNRGYRVTQFGTGQAALESLRGETPDLIIMDIVMPGDDGLEVARQIRQFSQVPILMLSVRDEVTTKTTALEIGADDYLTKPFAVAELLARIRAILRRTRPGGLDSATNLYQSGRLHIDLRASQVTIDQRQIRLTGREWAVLRVLVNHVGETVPARQLLQEAWGPGYGDETDYIRTYITRLRHKLEVDPKHPQYILLERGIGYRLADADADT